MEVCSDCKSDHRVDCIASYQVTNVHSITLNGIFSLKMDEKSGFPGAIAGREQALTHVSWDWERNWKISLYFRFCLRFFKIVWHPIRRIWLNSNKLPVHG